MLGVEPSNVHSSGDMKVYILCLEDVHYYFAVKTRESQRAAGWEHYNRRVRINAETMANAINAIYSHAGVERRAEVRWHEDGTPYIILTKAIRSKTAVASGDRERLKASTEGLSASDLKRLIEDEFLSMAPLLRDDLYVNMHYEGVEL